MFDDDRPKKRVKAQPGEDLSLLSISELEERIEIYGGEIERLRRDIETKKNSRQAANAFFKL